MSEVQAAFYARVSSESQASAQTVASQVAALRERLAADGCRCAEASTFIDEGYSGATLVRPALERLRDCVAAGALDRLYVHSPDRLARKYAYQVLLIDEFQRAGVEVVFLNRALGPRARKMSCCSRSRGWWPSPSGPRSSSAAAAGRAPQGTAWRAERALWGAIWLPLCQRAGGRRTGAL
jgi:hypothetical protein